jgi:hypothetical protein
MKGTKLLMISFIISKIKVNFFAFLLIFFSFLNFLFLFIDYPVQRIHSNQNIIELTNEVVTTSKIAKRIELLEKENKINTKTILNFILLSG